MGTDAIFLKQRMRANPDLQLQVTKGGGGILVLSPYLFFQLKPKVLFFAGFFERSFGRAWFV